MHLQLLLKICKLEIIKYIKHNVIFVKNSGNELEEWEERVLKCYDYGKFLSSIENTRNTFNITFLLMDIF